MRSLKMIIKLYWRGLLFVEAAARLYRQKKGSQNMRALSSFLAGV